ncbi:hypothetical protein [Pedobacter agri]|uniref:hypothetical protein n=1 Tax=Pedobacter agri TaxID=454586 RepID=UPI00292D502A|nr:hypothetical protein [Pedobacter agri]
MKVFHKLIITALLLLLLLKNHVFARIERPVIWSYLVNKTNKTEAIIYLKAAIKKGWHIYSQNAKEGVAVKTSFKFCPSNPI